MADTRSNGAPANEPALMTGLHRDHANTAALLKLLDAEAAVLLTDQSPDYEALLDIMDYFVTYPDQYHHRNEDLIFQRLLALEDEAPVADSVRTLGEQHHLLAKIGRDLIDTINRILDGGMIARSDVNAEITGYTCLLREHMTTEDQVVFPAALELLVDDDWIALDKTFEQRDDPLFGEIVSHRYVALADRLASARAR